MSVLTLTKSPVRVQSTRQGDDAPHKRSNKPQPTLRDVRLDVREMMADYDADERAAIVGRFRL